MSAPPYTFNSPLGADVILRAPLQPESDEFRDFHVHKIILSIASSVFQDTFSVPQPPRFTSERTTLDVIPVTEPATVLEPFLQLIYPVDPPVIKDLRLVDDLFRLADKYATKGVSARLRKLLVSPSFLEHDPIGVFAIACRSNLDEEERLAVSHTFSIDVISKISREHLRAMTTETYHRLLEKHAVRRQQLIYAVDQVRRSWCGCVENVTKEIRLVTSGRPFLDREILDTCLSSAKGVRCGGGSCICVTGYGGGFSSAVMRAIQAMPTGGTMEEFEAAKAIKRTPRRPRLSVFGDD